MIFLEYLAAALVATLCVASLEAAKHYRYEGQVQLALLWMLIGFIQLAVLLRLAAA